MKSELLDLKNLKKVPLHPELAKCLRKGVMGKMIGHPLIHEIIYFKDINELYNEQYRVKLEAAKQALELKQWDRYIWFHEKPYRLQAFIDIHEKVTDQEYWEILGTIWIESDNVWQNMEGWRIFLKSQRPYSELFMDKEDRQMLRTLPDPLVVYRGYQPRRNKHGLSYTLDEQKAWWFANRFGKNGKVLKMEVKKEDAFAYMSMRNESEIILKPKENEQC